MTTFQPQRGGDRLLPVEEAQQQVLAEAGVIDAEEVALADALGRVLREDVVAPADIPQRDNSGMDGYAIRADDVMHAPVSLRVVGDLPAGTVSTTRVEPGTAIRIMTGAMIPDGADAVAQVEITDAGSDVVRIDSAVSRGANIRKRGEDIRAGDVVLRDGTLLRAGEIGVLASVRKTSLRVSRKPVVAILSTGNEVVDAETPAADGKIVNSNAWSLAALVRDAGGVPRLMGIVADELPATIAAIESALDADFVISTGGVSVGAFDFVKDALDALGGETRFWRVAMKPGKPVVLSRVRDRLYFGLPGNPVSCMVAFLLFVAPALRKSSGMRDCVLPPIVQTRLGAAIKSKGDRRTYFRVRVTARDGELHAMPMRAQGSGVLTSMVGANGLAIVEERITHVDAGTSIATVLIAPVVSG